MIRGKKGENLLFRFLLHELFEKQVLKYVA
jgi:hypothetical protein